MTSRCRCRIGDRSPIRLLQRVAQLVGNWISNQTWTSTPAEATLNSVDSLHEQRDTTPQPYNVVADAAEQLGGPKTSTSDLTPHQGGPDGIKSPPTPRPNLRLDRPHPTGRLTACAPLVTSCESPSPAPSGDSAPPTQQRKTRRPGGPSQMRRQATFADLLRSQRAVLTSKARPAMLANTHKWTLLVATRWSHHAGKRHR